MTALPRITRTMLAAYPPSFRDRYGAEQVALLEDTGTKGTTLDLVRGALRAWVVPSFGERGVDWRQQRRLATVSTLWVMWIAAFFAGLSWNRIVSDPLVPFVMAGPGWAMYRLATSAFFVGVYSVAAVVVVTFAGVVLRLRRTKQLSLLRPLYPFLGLCVLQAVGLFGLSRLRWTHWVDGRTTIVLVHGVPQFHVQFPPLYIVLLLAWLALCIPTAWFGVTRPIRVLRAAPPSVRSLNRTLTFGAIPLLALVLLTMATTVYSAVEIKRGYASGLSLDLVATAGLLAVTVIAAVSYVRVIPVVFRSPLRAE